MGALTVIHGTVVAQPTVQVLGTEDKPIYAATLEVKSVRYDYIRKKNVGDLFTLQVQGKIAKKIHEAARDGGLNQISVDDEVVAHCETQLHAKGPVFFIKDLKVLGREGFELHILCGAVENGASGEIERDDREDGYWANGRLRVPSEKYDNPDETTSRNYNISAWDRKAQTLSKHIIPEKEDKESERRWVFVAGHSKTEKRNWTDEEGQEHTRYDFKTEVDLLEFTKVSTKPHVYESVEKGGSGGEMEEDDMLAMAQAQAEADEKQIEDDDIPF